MSDQARAERALTIFKRLHISDVPGRPTFGEAAEQWVFDFLILSLLFFVLTIPRDAADFARNIPDDLKQNTNLPEPPAYGCGVDRA
jgi:hypothetical protein